MLRGAGGPLSVPTCFRSRHVNQAGLGILWAGVRLCEETTQVSVRL